MTDRSGKAIAGIFLLLLLAGGSSIDTSSSSGSTSDGGDDFGDDDFDGEDLDDGGGPPSSECEDGIDNDGDGMTDFEDPNCDPNSPTFNDTEGGA